MGSLPPSPIEKAGGLLNQPTTYSHASSSTFHSKISLSTFRHVASSLGLLRSQKKPDDVEQQSGGDVVEDNASVFAPGGPDGTKVRNRK
jgi:hypothetical protein